MSDNTAEDKTDGGKQHPAAQHADQLAWAVYVGDSHSDSEMLAVVADSEQRAKNKALNRSERDGEVVHIDGPFTNSEPGVWEFEYITEHRETVVVEAPNKDYAEESAEAQRTHRGEYKRTSHTESRRLNVEPKGVDHDS
jgi:hypothetical protein